MMKSNYYEEENAEGEDTDGDDGAGDEADVFGEK
jgi:hypothetical protein